MSQYKHLTFQERICIEESLDKRISINMIAKQLKKSRSTIAREIQRNRYQIGIGRDVCRYIKFKYQAKRAQLLYEENLTDSRSGISYSPSEIAEIDNLVSPLLLNGQSISTVFFTHANDLPCCERTLYNLVNGCYLTARNIDLPRKVKFKTRYKHGNGRNHDVFTFDRTYADFKNYLIDNPDVSICEMDTVIGKNEQGISHYILQCFRVHSGFSHVTTECMSAHVRSNLWHAL